MSNVPKRRYEVDIHIGADDRQSLIHALNSILFNVENLKVDDEPIDITSAGWEHHHTVTGRVDPSITGDSYRQTFKQWCADNLPTTRLEEGSRK